jgi:hypothetical protein
MHAQNKKWFNTSKSVHLNICLLSKTTKCVRQLRFTGPLEAANARARFAGNPQENRPTTSVRLVTADLLRLFLRHETWSTLREHTWGSTNLHQRGHTKRTDRALWERKKEESLCGLPSEIAKYIAHIKCPVTYRRGISVLASAGRNSGAVRNIAS